MSIGQSSGAFRENNAALVARHRGIFNSLSTLVTSALTQSNPPIVTVTSTISAKLADLNYSRAFGVLSGSVAFTRPDAGAGKPWIGGPVELAAPTGLFVRPVGIFINNALGNLWENLPGVASGVGPYASAQGTYENYLFETQALAVAGAIAQGTTLIYQQGQELIASRNGYLVMRVTAQTGAAISLDIPTIASERANGQAVSTQIALLKMPPDSTQNALIYDQRI